MQPLQTTLPSTSRESCQARQLAARILSCTNTEAQKLLQRMHQKKTSIAAHIGTGQKGPECAIAYLGAKILRIQDLTPIVLQRLNLDLETKFFEFSTHSTSSWPVWPTFSRVRTSLCKEKEKEEKVENNRKKRKSGTTGSVHIPVKQGPSDRLRAQQVWKP